MARSYAFPEQSWEKVESRYQNLVAQQGRVFEFLEPMLMLIRSVVAEGGSEHLAPHTSVFDLVVSSKPLSEDWDCLRISISASPARVTITHETPRGLGDQIQRPTEELVPLFWRFANEKYGIHPARDYR